MSAAEPRRAPLGRLAARTAGARPPATPGGRLLLAVGALVGAVASVAPAALAPAAGASTVGDLQARAATIAARLNAVNARLEVLGEEYDQAKLRSASLGRQIVGDKASLAGAQSEVARDTKRLRRDAVAAYVAAGSANGFSVLMDGSANSLPLQQTYLKAASSTIRTAVTALQDGEHRLSVRETTLSLAETQATKSADTLAHAKTLASTLASQLSASQAAIKGKLAAAVAAQEQLQQAQAAARARALAAAAPTVTEAAAQPGPPTPPAQSGTVATNGASGGGSGAVAVHAAETQLGVPYVWGGATPGSGFDCSGLAMWAWSQAGVNLPHSAQAQYDSIAHVSMSDLQPGDLIFYASGGYIYHVIMYIGGGQAIQAEDTGTVIQITPVWGGAYGAGRP